ncbi:MAG: hypothetical protein KFF73_12115 [Cyclobacteriaceae bacterium]|nr:hypothetical protein [Cyclobacteriaceae bacterium]
MRYGNIDDLRVLPQVILGVSIDISGSLNENLMVESGKKIILVHEGDADGGK